MSENFQTDQRIALCKSCIILVVVVVVVVVVAVAAATAAAAAAVAVAVVIGYMYTTNNIMLACPWPVDFGCH